MFSIFSDAKSMIMTAACLFLFTFAGFMFYSYNSAIKDNVQLKNDKVLLQHSLDEAYKTQIFLDDQRRIQEAKVNEARKLLSAKDKELSDLQDVLEKRPDSSVEVPEYLKELFRKLP